jgi:aminoglycoside phosphotransferase (APT) family kinase protein
MSQRDSDLGRRLIDTAIDEIHAIAGSVDPDLANRLSQAADLVVQGQRVSSLDEEQTEALAKDVSTLSAEMTSEHVPASLYEAALRLLDGNARRPESEKASAEVDASDERAPAELTAEDVRGYLRARFATRDEVFTVATIHGGFSKRTTLVDCTLDGVRRQIVLRQAPAGRSPRSLGPEFALLETLFARGLPVPRPLWIEAEENVLGGAFFVTERARGRSVGDVWGGRGIAAETCLQLAELYATLHTTDPTGLPAPVSPRVSRDDLLAMIQWQEDTLLKRGIAIEPVLGSLLTWLRLHLPDAPVRPSIIHGDAAFSNLLVEDGHVTTILDWEAAHVGNAAEELAYLRPTVEPVVPWATFLDRYLSSGGIEPDPEAMRFFTVWSHVWRHVGCLWLAQNFATTGRHASAVAGYALGPRFLRAAVESAFGPAANEEGH